MKLLTLARDLKRRKARDRQQLFVTEGVRATEELLRSPLAIRGALVAPQLADAPRGAALKAALTERGVPVEEVEAREFASAAETDSPQGVVGIAEIPERSFASLGDAWSGVVLLLDGVQDPGNVGTIVRSAAALGAAAVVALPGTVDLWNAKVVRSGMGAHFRHVAFGSTWTDVDAFRAKHPVPVWAADARGEPLAAAEKPRRLLLIVGNEGAGLSAEGRARAERTIALPTEADVAPPFHCRIDRYGISRQGR